MALAGGANGAKSPKTINTFSINRFINLVSKRFLPFIL
jgi:hypothetical protein